MVYLDVFLALFWGIILAAFLQFVELGRFLARKRTWVTVVLGVGVDLAIALLVMPWEWWHRVTLVILASSVGIIYRSLYNEQKQSTARPRLPNKVIWNIDDIGAICGRVQEALRGAEARVDEIEDAQLLAALATVGREVEVIRRRARDARHGEYEL